MSQSTIIRLKLRIRRVSTKNTNWWTTK
jgi:hypothetical protein